MRSVLTRLSLLVTTCDCVNEMKAVLPSPDGRRKVAVFDRNCGATTGSNLQVSILPPTESPKEGGNALIVDLERDSSLMGVELTSLVGATWLSPTQLAITYNPRLRIFKREDRVDGVEIVYSRSRNKPGLDARGQSSEILLPLRAVDRWLTSHVFLNANYGLADADERARAAGATATIHFSPQEDTTVFVSGLPSDG